MKTTSVGTTTSAGSSSPRMATLLGTPEGDRKLVEVKVPNGLVDMFGKPYSGVMHLWVHHYENFGVLVEGTYEIRLARKALKKAGYEPSVSVEWGYRPTLIGQDTKASGWGAAVGGRPCMAFYFDVENGLYDG